MQRLPEFQHSGQRGSFRAWLYRLVRSKTTDQVRYRNHRMKERLYGILSAFVGNTFEAD